MSGLTDLPCVISIGSAPLSMLHDRRQNGRAIFKFCVAELWSSLFLKSAVKKTKHCPFWDALQVLVTFIGGIRPPRSRPFSRTAVAIIRPAPSCSRHSPDRQAKAVPPPKMLSSSLRSETSSPPLPPLGVSLLFRGSFIGPGPRFGPRFGFTLCRS